MGIIFDGKKYAQEKEKELKLKIRALLVTPKLVSILVGNNKASVIYTNLKKEAAKKVGIKFEIVKLPEESTKEEIIKKVKELNDDASVHGIMVQLPLPDKLKSKTKGILNTIAKEKDVDGLKDNSPFTPATVKAILGIINVATCNLTYFGKKAAVVGASGVVGKSIVMELRKLGYKVNECDKDTRDLYAKLHEMDLIISATGVPGLIKGEMIKEGSIVIDVGAPLGDFGKSASTRASFFTPVPGGVGPVTVISLLENLIESVS